MWLFTYCVKVCGELFYWRFETFNGFQTILKEALGESNLKKKETVKINLKHLNFAE